MNQKSEKEKLRADAKLLRSKISASEQNQNAQTLLSWAPLLANNRTWLLYSPIQNELSPLPLFNWARAHNVRCLFPRIKKDKMEFAEVKDLKELVKGSFSLEPSGPTENIANTSEALILIPGLLFNRFGQRIGYGKGHYDRFLQAHEHPFRMGLAHTVQIKMQAWQDEAHDQKLDGILTPCGLWGSKRVL